MALASILYIDGTIRPIDVDKALAAYDALTGKTEPSEAQAEWLCSIKRIFLPPSVRPADYEPVSPYQHEKPVVGIVRSPGDDMTAPTQTSLTNPGIEQGKSQALPTGDR